MYASSHGFLKYLCVQLCFTTACACAGGEVSGLDWTATPCLSIASRACGPGRTGLATRACLANRVWGPVDVSACRHSLLSGFAVRGITQARLGSEVLVTVANITESAYVLGSHDIDDAMWILRTVLRGIPSPTQQSIMATTSILSDMVNVSLCCVVWHVVTQLVRAHHPVLHGSLHFSDLNCLFCMVTTVRPLSDQPCLDGTKRTCTACGHNPSLLRPATS
jgi:hypothetical protein